MAELTKQTRSYTRRNIQKDVKWFLVDAAGVPLGRLAGRVASVLKGKHRPQYTPSTDMGDCVVVLNAGKVKLTGKKAEQKEKFRHSMYPGGAVYTQYKKMMKEKPEDVIYLAVKGMLPKSALGKRMIKKLLIYKGKEHPHKAQKVEPIPQHLINY
jgi:large subunit ribosomal protein L13